MAGWFDFLNPVFSPVSTINALTSKNKYGIGEALTSPDRVEARDAAEFDRQQQAGRESEVIQIIQPYMERMRASLDAIMQTQDPQQKSQAISAALREHGGAWTDVVSKKLMTSEEAISFVNQMAKRVYEEERRKILSSSLQQDPSNVPGALTSLLPTAEDPYTAGQKISSSFANTEAGNLNRERRVTEIPAHVKSLEASAGLSSAKTTTEDYMRPLRGQSEQALEYQRRQAGGASGAHADLYRKQTSNPELFRGSGARGTMQEKDLEKLAQQQLYRITTMLNDQVNYGEGIKNPQQIKVLIDSYNDTLNRLGVGYTVDVTKKSGTKNLMLYKKEAGAVEPVGPQPEGAIPEWHRPDSPTPEDPYQGVTDLPFLDEQPALEPQSSATDLPTATQQAGARILDSINKRRIPNNTGAQAQQSIEEFMQAHFNDLAKIDTANGVKEYINRVASSPQDALRLIKEAYDKNVFRVRS